MLIVSLRDIGAGWGDGAIRLPTGRSVVGGLVVADGFGLDVGQGVAPFAELPERAAASDDTELRLVLRSALLELEPLDRAVVVLRYLDDVSVDEVGRTLGLSSTAVRSRAKRALAKVRATLGVHLPDLALS